MSKPQKKFLDVIVSKKDKSILLNYLNNTKNTSEDIKKRNDTINNWSPIKRFFKNCKKFNILTIKKPENNSIKLKLQFKCGQCYREVRSSNNLEKVKDDNFNKFSFKTIATSASCKLQGNLINYHFKIL